MAGCAVLCSTKTPTKLAVRATEAFKRWSIQLVFIYIHMSRHIHSAHSILTSAWSEPLLLSLFQINPGIISYRISGNERRRRLNDSHFLIMSDDQHIDMQSSDPVE